MAAGDDEGKLVPDSGSAPSLTISFAGDVTKAVLRARPDCHEDLKRLALRFRTGVMRISGELEVDIEDLLLNLAALASWPENNSVRWDEHLARFATDTARDAQLMAARLEGIGPSAEVAPEEVPDLLGEGWKAPLTPFQLRDIARLLSLKHGANFSVPGAGKTRVALAVFHVLRSRGIERLLIVCPKSAYESWTFENQHCLAEPLHMEVFGKNNSPSTESFLVNYERLRNDGVTNYLGQWLSARPSMLILDEAHRMKLGAEGIYGSACFALGPRARHRLILTGTPAPNGAKDLENLFSFVWPGIGRQKVVQAVGGGDLVKASRVLRPLFTRTTKKELGLPPAKTRIRALDLPPLHQEIYDALRGQFSVRAKGHEGDFMALGKISLYMLMAAISPALLVAGTTPYEPLLYRVPPLEIPPDSHLAELMRNLPDYELSPKYREAVAIVADNASKGRKTLVWSTFVRSLNTLSKLLQQFRPALVHSGTKDRDAEISRFRNDPDCMVLLSNPATLGEGISLHHTCHDAVYIDRDFAAGRFLQSLDRIHRLGLDPDTETRVTILACAGTIDEVVEQRLAAKLEFMGSILDDPTVRELADLYEEPAVGGGLDEKDLQALLGHLSA